MHAENLIILVSTTLLLSYLSSLIYSKTKIPDILWLMGFGIIVGPVLGLFDKDLFVELAPLMSIIALSIILFEAGINVDVVTLLEMMGKASSLSIASILSVILIVGFILNKLFPQDFTLPQAMLLGSMIGGTSTVSVFGIVSDLSKRIENLSSTYVMLTMESVLSDPLCIISSITLIRMIMLPDVSLRDGIRDIFTIFLLSSILGLAIGLLWAKILSRLRGRSLTYIITIAVLLPSYIVSESIIGDGGGAMTALTFGLAITNYRYLMGLIGIDSKVLIDKQKLREFHEEITFFVKSFFFVYIGLIVSLSLKFTLIGMGIVLLIMTIRYVIVEVLSNILHFNKQEKVISQFVYASGLPAFVMSQLPMIFDPSAEFFVSPGIYPDLCMPIVLGTVMYSAVLGPFAANRRLAPKKEAKKQEKET